MVLGVVLVVLALKGSQGGLTRTKEEDPPNFFNRILFENFLTLFDVSDLYRKMRETCVANFLQRLSKSVHRRARASRLKF